MMLVRLTEEDVLNVFYARVRDADRIDALREMVAVVLARPSDWDARSIRDDARSVTCRLTADQCFTCLSAARWLYWHHVIQIQHGGSNAPRNLVPLCHRCHRRIHPWLKPETTMENRFGWTAIADCAERALTRLSALIGT